MSGSSSHPTRQPTTLSSASGRKVNFFQLNCHRSPPPAHLLDRQLCRSKFASIALVQEPHVHTRSSCNRLTGFSSRHLQFTGSSTGKCRTGIVINDPHLQALFCPRFSDTDTCTISTIINGTQTFIASVYLDIVHMELPQALTALLQYADSSSCPLILGMDTNSHSTLWGSPQPNARGEWLEDIIFANNLTVCNSGTSPTFYGGGGAHATHIDVTLCSHSLSPHIPRWFVDSTPSGSDHRLVRFSCFMKLPSPDSSTQHINPKLINWDDFKADMQSTSQPLLSTMNSTPLSPAVIETWTTSFYDDVRAALTSASTQPPVNRTSTTRRSRSVPWWSKEIAVLQNTCKLAWKTYSKQQKYQSPTLFEAYDHYRESRRAMKKAIQKAKRCAWQRHVSEVQNPVTMARLCRSLHKGPLQPVGLLRNSSGQYADSAQAVSNILFEKFFPQSTVTKSPVAFPLLMHDIPDEVVTDAKIELAFASFNKNKAAGPDHLKPLVLQALSGDALTRVAIIYTGCLRIGYVPLIWRQAKVILINKPGKSDPTDVKSFRPISLTCFLFKGLERLLYWDLLSNFLPQSPLSTHQHAFRKGRSTDTALSTACNYIESKIFQGQYAMGLFLDIEGAFDNVSPDKALSCMREHGFPDYMAITYNYYLLHRQATIRVGHLSTTRHLTRGVPQGGILSPLIWNLIFDHLLLRCHTGPVKAIGYADDALLLTSGLDPSILLQNLQTSLNTASLWSAENGLRLSPAKTLCMLFHRSPRRAAQLPPKPLMLHGQPVKFEAKIRYLGLILTPNLTWHAHIADRTQKAKRKLHILRSAVGIKWGPSPHLMQWAYKAIVIPTLTYGHYVWAPTPIALKQQRQLSSLNRLALTHLAPIRSRTPSAGLEMIFNQPPLPLTLRSLGMAAHLRLVSFHSSPTWSGVGRGKTVGHIRAWSRVFDSLHIPFPKEDKCDPFQSTQQLAVHLPTEPFPVSTWRIRCLFQENLTKAKFINCWIDIRSSDLKTHLKFTLCIPGSQWAGAACPTGISFSLQSLLPLIAKGDTVSLHHDGMFNLILPQTIDTASTQLLAALLSQLRLRSSHPIRLIDNRLSHDDITFLTSIKSSPTPVPVQLLILSLPTVQSLIASTVHDSWCHTWSSLDECRQTRAWFPEPRPAHTRKLLRLPRETLGLVVQWITGHGWLKCHCNVLDSSVDPRCRLCGDLSTPAPQVHSIFTPRSYVDRHYETPLHLWTHCPHSNIALELASVGADRNASPLEWEVQPLVQFLSGRTMLGLLSSPRA